MDFPRKEQFYLRIDTGIYLLVIIKVTKPKTSNYIRRFLCCFLADIEMQIKIKGCWKISEAESKVYFPVDLV